LTLKQSYHFPTDFYRVLLQLVDILNTLFKYPLSCQQLTFILETFELLVKSYMQFSLLFVNILRVTACLLEKIKP